MYLNRILTVNIALVAAACAEYSMPPTLSVEPSSLESGVRVEAVESPAAARMSSAEPTSLPSNLYLLLDEGNIPIENGDSYQVAEDLNVQITIDPYPPIGLSAHLVLDLYLTNRLGDPINDADISLRYDMFQMTHGPFESTMINRGRGHYLASLDLVMFGAWGVETTIRTQSQSRTYQLTNAVIVSLPPQ